MRLGVLEPVAREVMDMARTWSGAPPEFIANLSDRVLVHTLADRTRMPEGATRMRHGTARVRFGPVMVYGSHHFHAVVDAAGRMALQESSAERVRFRLAHHLANPAPHHLRVPRLSAGAPMEIDLTAAEPVALHEPVFFASPIEPDNWGMWLLNTVPAVADWHANGWPQRLMCWLRFKWQRALLNFLDVPDERLVVQRQWQAYTVPGLAMHQYTAVDLVPTASDMAAFLRLAERCGPPAAGGERLFISRRSFTARFGHRRLVNEDELIAALAARGFRILEPETLPIREQVRVFRGARLVVGLGGAAMFSTVFCEPRTRVISIESGPGYADNHASLFAGMGHPYGFIFGRQDEDDPAPEHKRWTLDVDRAVRQIAQFE